MSRRIALVAALGFSHATLAAGVAHALGIGINVTTSQPVGLYRAVPGTARRGDLVRACLPGEAAALATARGYLRPRGACGDHEPVLKRVLATAGDRVELGAVVVLDGEPVAAAPVLAADLGGRPLPRAADATLGPGELWLISDRIAHSFDSRYFGPVSASAVLDVMRPLWVL